MGWIHGDNEPPSRGKREKLSQEEWDEAVKKHQLQLAGEEGGKYMAIKYCIIDSSINMEGIDLTRASFKEVVFHGVKISHRINSATFVECIFNYVDFSNAVFVDTKVLMGCEFRSADLTNSTWLGCQFLNMSFYDTCFEGAILSGAWLSCVLFGKGTSLNGATINKTRRIKGTPCFRGPISWPLDDESTIYVDAEFKEILVGLLQSQLKIKE